jgi:hypothetical protein
VIFAIGALRYSFVYSLVAGYFVYNKDIIQRMALTISFDALVAASRHSLTQDEQGLFTLSK